MRYTILFYLVLILFISCSSNKQIKTTPKRSEIPKSYDVSSLDRDIIKAEGISPKMVIHAAQIKRAKHQARVELSNTFNVRVSELVKDWIEENQDYFTNQGEALSYFEATSEGLTSATLRGVEIVKTWDDPSTGETHAIAAIGKYDAIKKYIDEVNKLPPTKTKIIQDRADKAFKELESKLQQELQ